MKGLDPVFRKIVCGVTQDKGQRQK